MLSISYVGLATPISDCLFERTGANKGQKKSGGRKVLKVVRY